MVYVLVLAVALAGGAIALYGAFGDAPPEAPVAAPESETEPTPQDEVGGNAEDWVEEITEVMLAAEEGDDDDADRDYGAFMGDYNEVVPANEASRRPP